MWLMGPLTPMRFESTVDDCIVTRGEVPESLNGGFYRCGGTWKRPSRQGLVGPFTLDGIVETSLGDADVQDLDAGSQPERLD